LDKIRDLSGLVLDKFSLFLNTLWGKLVSLMLTWPEDSVLRTIHTILTNASVRHLFFKVCVSAPVIEEFCRWLAPVKFTIGIITVEAITKIWSLYGWNRLDLWPRIIGPSLMHVVACWLHLAKKPLHAVALHASWNFIAMYPFVERMKKLAEHLPNQMNRRYLERLKLIRDSTDRIDTVAEILMSEI
jgi:hypothetical protein